MKIFIFLLIAGLFSTSSAGALKHSDRFEINAGGDLPFYAGALVRYNMSTQFYTKLSAGFAMEFFVKAHQKVLEGLGFEREIALMTRALANSFVAEARVGLSSHIYSGAYAEAGYSLMLFGKGQLDKTAVSNFFRVHLEEAENIYAHVTHHGPSLHIGYKMNLVENLSLSVDIGAYKPLFSITKLESIPQTDSTMKMLGKMSEQAVNDFVVKKLFFLSLGLWLGLGF